MSTLVPTRPRIAHFPDAPSSAGVEIIDLARMAGLVLDPWQEFVILNSLGERPDGKWAAFEVGVMAERQNGKGGILEARELGGLYILNERLLTHSAHQFDTSLEAFRRLLFLIEETPELSRRLKRVSRSHGEEGIELMSGQRIRFRTRTKGGGRGFSGDFLALDEAMILPETAHGALLPTLSARPNPQVWYAGSAVDQIVHPDGVVFARVRERGIAADPDDSLAYFEWSADVDENPSAVSADVLDDRDLWRQANPALGIRISEEHIAHERASMDPRTFAVERLGIGDWPSTDPGGDSVIDIHRWRALTDAESAVPDPVVFAFDVTPDRRSAAIGVAGRREDGLLHAEVVDARGGTGWVADRLAELQARHTPLAVLCDGASPAASLEDACRSAGVDVEIIKTADYVRACGLIFDVVDQERLRHRGQPELDAAIRGAAKRPLNDAWAWSRKSSGVDISPLVAVTIALWRVEAHAPKPFLLT